ncbi:Fe-S-cluster containining protein [Roseateles asaccharophilus]|uniref:YkgJ family cysteine cluster protein n=1 Tax=Roseateles asaccharophilus TaxID=582607 RepID=UPI0038372518
MEDESNLDAGVRHLHMSILNGMVKHQTSAFAAVKAGKATPLNQVIRVYLTSDQVLSSVPYPPEQPLACEAGCGFCCHLTVLVHPNEALAIAEHVAGWPAEMQAGLRERLESNVQATKGLPLATREVTNVPCAFLREDQSCGIYPIRPMACRRHHSLNLDSCIKAYESPTAGIQNEMSILAIAASDAFMASTVLALEANGMDHSRFEMNAAVLEALTNPAAIKRWKSGKLTFPSAEHVDRTGGLTPEVRAQYG